MVLVHGEKNERYKLIEVPEKEPDPKFSHEPTPKWKPKIEQCVVQIPRLKVCFTLDHNFLTKSMTRLMHLIFSQEVEIISGWKE